MENFINLSQRQLRVGEQVRQIISNFLLKDIVLDNYLTNASITVSRVIMSKDLKIAYVYVMPLGGSNIENVNDGGLEGEERLRYVEKEAIKLSLGNLKTFPWLKERVHEGKLALHGWLFNLEECAMLKYLAPDGWENL